MDKIARALEKTTDTKDLFIGTGALKKVPEMFLRLFGKVNAVVVADTNTFEVAGREVCDNLKDAGIIVEKPFIFDDPDLFAEWSYLESLEKYLGTLDAVAVAVGSGVINDLVKLSSFHLGRKYMVAGTAASMDGYTAYGASVTFEGNKQTFDCSAPAGMVLDPAIAAAAPAGMSASGYADLMAKIPAGADWMLAEAAGVETVDEFSFGLVQSGLRESLSKPEAVANGEVKSTELLARGLVMSGFAMQAYHSSRPASGMEHQFSHYWDMEDLHYKGKHVSHGFKVGIGTLVSTACFEYLLGSDLQNADIEKCVESWPDMDTMNRRIESVFQGKPGHKARALEETRAKYVGKDGLRKELSGISGQWPSLKDQISRQIYTFDEVRDSLRKAGAPYEPEMIGITRARLKETFIGIPYMRSRFTVIDAIMGFGLMDNVADYLFGEGGHWKV
ncbi:MAG: sn-glycerol-1-phosphate dehydrogenase [Bacteroidales bacterium]|jgi:glycerol-1-phosphate dehydrogenase [NAD(P)+]|nr:sn-glycerol-1-phosphate dehydrogenase [Bacteroidales bacterium]MCI1785572.1 sn-glycerol-1-phosphate dehydrogenase [Bacteroidales bacterium]